MLRMKVRIEGADEVLRALAKLPADANKAMREQAKDIATSLADKMKYAARASSRQAAKLAPTVRESNVGVWPAITAGGGRWGFLLFGSEFGATRHFGWYARARYFDSTGKQFPEHLGGGSHWFFATAEAQQPWVASEWSKAGDTVVREWSA